MQDSDFEWDDEKAAQSYAKHRITFDFARTAFEDPNWVEYDDPDPHELRYNRICMAEGRVIVVTYVERGQRTRIISARRADKHDERRYVAGPA